MRPDSWAIVAARNEADRVGETLAALRDAVPDIRVVVADDASTDATAALARAGGAEVVCTARNVGKGGAVTRAAEHVLTRERDERTSVLLCDADLGRSASALTRLLEAIERGDGDLAVAAFARRVGGGFGIALGAARWTIARRTGLRPVAPISGQRALRIEVLRAVVPFAHGFGMEVGMTIDAHRAGFSLVEVELELAHRATGRTPAGFLHRGAQLLDIARVYASRR